jgi:hypothetical protein
VSVYVLESPQQYQKCGLRRITIFETQKKMKNAAKVFASMSFINNFGMKNILRQ